MEKSEKVETIFRQYKNLMVHTAYAITHNWHEAEDIASDAMMKIMHLTEKIDENNCNKTRGFIVILTRRTAIDSIRKTKKRNEVPLDDFIDYPFIGTDLSDDVEVRETVQEVMDTLPGMHKPYSDILFYSAVMGFSDDEIAKMLGISSGNVRVRLSRARKDLAQRLEKGDICYNV